MDLISLLPDDIDEPGWVVYYQTGSMTCPNLNQSIPPSDPDPVVITVQDEGRALEDSDWGETGTVRMNLTERTEEGQLTY